MHAKVSETYVQPGQDEASGVENVPCFVHCSSS